MGEYIHGHHCEQLEAERHRLAQENMQLKGPYQSPRLWFKTPQEAIRWMRDEARQWRDDNPKVAAHLFEAAAMFEKAIKEGTCRRRN